VLAAAAVGASNDLEEVAIGIFEVHASAPIVAVDFTLPGLARVGPVTEPAVSDASEDGLEIFLPDQEGVMLGGDLPVGLVKVE
jgi:hypothetical protein